MEHMVSDTIKEFLFKNRHKPLNIHCVGDAMVDEYFEVKVDRISPEFPMPIMTSTSDKPVRRPGGVANVAYQFKNFNVASTLICFRDSWAEDVFNRHGLYPHNGFSDHDIKAKLPIKKRFLDGKVQVKRWDIEKPNSGMTLEKIERYHELYAEYVEKTKMRPDVVVFSDYNKGFFFPSASVHFPDLYPGARTIVDPKNGPIEKWRGCNILKLNAKEARELGGNKIRWQEQAKYLQDKTNCEAVVITFAGEMVAGIWHGGEFVYKPEKGEVDVLSVVGAGDCFAAFFAMAIGHGFTVPEAVQIAYKAGSVYVQHNMNRPVCPVDLVNDKIVHASDLEKRDFKLVFTNGCFDVLHKGHLSTLKFAKSKGERLVVAVNADESVKRLKGESRPLVPLEHRMAVLAAMEDVDFVVPFHQDTPYELIRNIKPDVLVKGGDYDPKTIIGADVVPEVYAAPMIDGVSTSKLLAKS